MTFTQIPHLAFFRNRREKLIARVRQESGSGIVIIETAPVAMRNRDSDYPYRHDSDFFYLTGFDEPESVLVIQVTNDRSTCHLFCRPKDVEREIWDGLRLGPLAAPEFLGVDFAYSNEELNIVIPGLMKGFNDIYHRTGSNQSHTQMSIWLNEISKVARQGVKKPSRFHDVESIVHEMRLFKDDHEINTMRQAAKIAAKGHLQAMRVSKPDLREYHLEAELLNEFRKNGAQSVAYNSIVATGENACILHYRAGNAVLKDGDLCLIDAGCELNSYASDITRTFPVNGKFSDAQKEVYSIVLLAQEKAIEACVPGNTFQEPHEAAVKILTQGLFDLNILNHETHGTIQQAIDDGAYKPYYMHRTSHWLGMDVHDVGEYREPLDQNNGWRILQPGMVLTIEPGLYFRPSPEIPEKYWHIGIRIEDDVLIIEKGHEILSREVPVEIDEIEAWMAHP
jgi:Xaa-Pro aminopeptidase